MGTKTKRHIRLALCVLFFVMAGQAYGDISILPPNPTSQNIVTITVSGMWPDSCIPNASFISVAGNDIHFEVLHNYPPGIACALIVCDWQQTQSVGPLSPGVYTLWIELIGYPEYTQETYFTVSGPTQRNVPSQYSTIQAAINASSNGDVVIVAPGTYTGTGNKNLDFAGKAITVTSVNPQDPCVVAGTVIDCENSGRGFCFHSGEGNSSAVYGLTIKRGKVSDQGGGIYCSGSSPTIKNCTITSSVAYGSDGSNGGNGYPAYGGGIYADSGLIIMNCEISGNTAAGGKGGDGQGIPPNPAGNGGTARGGGVYGSNLQIINCLIVNNSAAGGNPGYDGGGGPGMGGYAYGGGIMCGQATIRNCTIVANTGSGGGIPPVDGGGIYGNSQTTVTNCILWNNAVNDLFNCGATYSCFGDGDSGVGNINSNPLFVAGPHGNYYLRQVAAGQSSNSPCVNAGSDTSLNLEMNLTTTRTDEMLDTGIVDMGYHYYLGIISPDLNNDKIVDFIDYAILSKDWLQPPDPCDPNNGDINKDGWIDIYDLVRLAEQWLSCFVTAATNPKPADNAIYVSLNTILNWTPGKNTTSHDIYFGTDFNEVKNADTGSIGVYMGNQDVNYWDSNSYDTNGLEPNTMFYWRIDEVAGCTAKGNVWSFTTCSEPNINYGLVAWWKFDEGTGTIAYDSAGTNNGTIYGATWATGQIGGALNFNGTSNYVDCGSGASNYDNITVSAWMKTSTAGVLVSNRYNSYSYGTWYTLTSTGIELGGNSSGSGYVNVTFNTPTTLNGLWHHIVYTKDGTNHAIYVDGSLDQSFTSNADISWIQPLFIGKRWTKSTSVGWFNGIIDDVRIYNWALNAEEVALLYQQGL